MPLVGWILIIVAALCVAGVLFVVVREHVETEEHYIPPSKADEEAKHTAEENA